MDTALWIACGLAAAAAGYFSLYRQAPRWPRRGRVALPLAIGVAQLLLIFCVDIEPPQGTTALRSGNVALSFWPATLLFMLHMGLLGAFLAALGPQPRPSGAD